MKKEAQKPKIGRTNSARVSDRKSDSSLPESGPPFAVSRTAAFVPALVIFIVVTWIYLPTTGNKFINFDDPLYITANPHVQEGLSPSSIHWAFTTFKGGFWHPLTWLSIMLDTRLFGLQPQGHHGIGLLLHATNSVLLFLVLLSITRKVWLSAFVAVLFGIHPLHVESIAWASERKDLLSTFFCILAIWSYWKYAREPVRAGDTIRSVNVFSLIFSRRKAARWYALSLVLLLMGLMSKAMIVTFPILLLLLDYWPLQRYRDPLLRRQLPGEVPTVAFLVAEKLPFFALVLASCVLTLFAQQAANAMGSPLLYPLKDRIANAFLSYAVYLIQTFWPLDLAIYYPYRESFPPLLVGAAVVLICGISAVAFGRRFVSPYLIFGWLWYLVALLPVIGFIQAGGQAHADRYTYIPLIGIFVACGWGGAEIVSRLKIPMPVVLVPALTVLCALTACTRRQLAFWKDSKTVFSHALEVTTLNELAENNLGTALVELGRPAEALPHFENAVRIMPDFAEARNNLGSALGRVGRYTEATNELQEALRLKPDSVSARCNLADAYAASGETAAAINLYEQALKMKPDDPIIHLNLGLALASVGRLDDAQRHYQRALELQPRNADAHNRAGVILGMTGNIEDAVEHLRTAIRINPDHSEAHCNLGIALVQQNRFAEAVPQFRKALERRPDYPEAHCNLGVALGRLGQFDQAVVELREALRLRPDYPDAQRNLEIALRTKQQPSGGTQP